MLYKTSNLPLKFSLGGKKDYTKQNNFFLGFHSFFKKRGKWEKEKYIWKTMVTESVYSKSDIVNWNVTVSIGIRILVGFV